METRHVQMSIGKLAVTLIVALVTATLVTMGIGLFTLHGDYRTFAGRQDAEAQDTVRKAALSIRNQVRFYQGILQLLPSRPEVADLLESGDTAEITEWTEGLRRILPGTLATDIVARLGGDEFALPLTHMAREGLHDWIASLLEDYDRSGLHSHDGKTLFCRLSVGIAAIDAEVSAAPQDAFDAADRVMYTVKQQREPRASHFAIADDGRHGITGTAVTT